MLAVTMMLAVVCTMTACGGKEVEKQEVDYDMTFENQTGIAAEKLEIRYAEDAEWAEIALTDGEWKSGYEMPVSMEGLMPVAEDGWQVQMTFEGDIQKVWEGVNFADDVILTFSLNEDMEPAVEMGISAEEAPVEETPVEEVPMEEAEVVVEENQD